MKNRNQRRSISRSRRARRTLFEVLEQRCVLSTAPTLAPIADITLYEGAPINLPLDAISELDSPLTYTIECSDPNLTVYVPEGNRSMKINVSAENGTITGDMIFELFEQRAPRVTHQIISLAEDGFYDGLTFHRVIDNFMIQGGDPTGTGSGNSYLGNFDDQFDLELMHTTSGVLSMAKSFDDTNDCQFFITEGPTRHLDFNHSVFGQLVEGEDIRETLSNLNTDSSDRPLNDVVMQSVEIFEDTENAILVINAPEGYAGSSSVTITVTIHDNLGNDYVQTPINVTIAADTENSDPCFTDLPLMRTPVDTPYTIDLSPYVQDAEGLESFTVPEEGEEIDYEHRTFFLDSEYLQYYSYQYVEQYQSYDYVQYTPYVEDEALGLQTFYEDPNVPFYTGIVSFEPSGGIAGTYPFSIATGVSLGSFDAQAAALNIVPDDAPDATIEMTLVNDPTTVDDQGEVDTLPTSDDWLSAWDKCSLEVWAKIDDPGQFGIYSVETDLSFDPDLYQVSDIEWGVGFSQEQTGVIDNENGAITGLGGTTKWYSIVSSSSNYENYVDPPSGTEDLIMWGDDQYVLVARVNLDPVYTNDDLKVKPGVGYNTAVTTGFALSEGDVKWNEIDGTDVTLSGDVQTDMWAVPYDLNGDAVVNLSDILQFLGHYQVDIDAPSNQWGYACDFNHDGTVQLNDLLLMLGQYQYTADGGTIELPDGFPFADGESQTASLMGTVAASELANDDSQDDDEDEENLASAIDQIMLLYGDV